MYRPIHVCEMNTSNTKKILIVIVTVLLLVGRGPFLALAQSTPPEPPQAPEAPEAPEYNYEPSEAPEPPQAPTPPPNPYSDEEDETPFVYEDSSSDQQQSSDDPQSAGGGSLDGQVGDSEIITGDAQTTGNITTIGNDNYSAGGGGSGELGATVVNDGNGAFSDNTGSASVVNNGNTIQENSAAVVNTMNEASVTGDNSTSFSVGDSSITTGDANTTGTIVTAVNTNVDGVAVAEFNIADDHVGDIILDFGEGCISGCGGGSVTAQNTNNGAGSDNFANTSDTTNSSTTQINDADVQSNLTLVADSGNNDASFNTAGDSSITTGDANVSGNILTFANNNIVGNVVYGVVNIFGDLIGDIILTQEALGALCGSCGGAVSAENSDNGANSNNTAVADQTINDATFQSNDATIENNLILASTTGDNTTSFNTDGDSAVTTGESDINANVLNIANMNISGGNLWLVIVNEAGKWIGRIMGAPDGSSYAGSAEIEFVVDENGEIVATNSGNGAGSDNFSSVDSTVNNTTVQDNTANIVNNVDLSANTGGNNSSFNTGGSSDIVTGDATVIANIVNFVNNNIVGGGTLVVTVVNVFGSWIGDFVGPGAKQDVGGSVAYNDPESFSSGQDSHNDDNSNNNDGGGSSDGGNSERDQGSGVVQGYAEEIPSFGSTNLHGIVYSYRATNNDSEELKEIGGVASVQAASTVIDTQTADSKVLKINIAWFIIFGGLILVYVVIGRARKGLVKVGNSRER